MIGDEDQHGDGIQPPEPDARAAARKRAIAIACVAANLRRAYRDGLVEPLPPAIDDLLRKLE